MRLLDLYEQLLLEHNVVNGDDIKKFVEPFAQECKHENAKKWFETVVVKYLTNDESHNVPMGDQTPLNAPDWLEVAQARGDDLRIFHPPLMMQAALDHLVDYFNWLAENEPRLMADGNRVMKVTVPVAMKKADEWSKAGSKAAAKTSVQDVNVIMRDGQYEWVEPTTLEALHRDGKIMQNCIGNGTYDAEFKSGSQKFYFLHDNKGEPHIAMSVHAYGRIGEALGKNNRVPVSRYVAYVANFVNSHLNAEMASQDHSIKSMGLVLTQEGKLGLKSATGKVVFKVGNVRVFETVSEATSVPSNRYRGDTNTDSIGGKDYYFVSPKEGELFAININTNNEAYIKAMEDDKKTEYLGMAKTFLNEYFTEAPVPQVLGRSSSLTNYLNIPYDFLVRKYGTEEEVSNKIGSVKGVDFYIRGTTLRSVVLRGNNGNDEISLGIGDDGSVDIRDYTFTNASLLIAALNLCGSTFKKLHPDSSYKGSVRQQNNIYYNAETAQWGTMEDSCPIIWKGGGHVVRRREESPDKVFLMFMKGSEELLEVSKVEIIYPNEIAEFKAADITSATRKILVTALQKCEEFSKQMSGVTYTALGIVNSNGKWRTRADAAEPFHRFDDGTYITKIPGDKPSYEFMSRDDDIVFSVVATQAGKIDDLITYDGFLSVSRNVQWLLNNMSFRSFDTSNLDSRNGGYRNIFWSLGLFYDNRSDSWKLVQDGKIWLEADDYRVVKFRNRFFIIDDKEGCVGYFKMPNEYSQQIEDIHGMSEFGFTETLGYISDIVKRTEARYLGYSDDGRRSVYTDQTLREKGFYIKENILTRIEEDFPTEVVVELPKGFKWVRKTVDKKFEDVGVDGERYSLIDNAGNSQMRAIFSDGLLSSFKFFDEDKLGYRASIDGPSQNMSLVQKKLLIALLEKIQAKLTPPQAKALGFYRLRSGKYKSLQGNADLAGFLEGKIVFPDGHEFRSDKYNTYLWELGKEDPDAENSWERFKPYIKVELDDEGIESVKYSRKEAKRNPKEYMPYLHKLMKIFHTISGE